MSDLRQQDLAILSIDQDIINNLNFDTIIHDFSIMKVNVYIIKYGYILTRV